METTKRIINILILVLFTVSPAISAETEFSNTTTASCLLKITSNPTVLPLEENVIEYLLRSSGVAGKAASEVLDTEFDNEFLEVEWLANEFNVSLQNPYHEESQMSEENDVIPMMGMDMGGGMMPGYEQRPPRFSRRPGMATISEPSNNEQMILMRIAVNTEPVGIGAEEFMNAILGNLDAALNRAFDSHKQRLSKQLILADEEVARTQSELTHMQERLNSISGSHILDRNRILNEIDNLRRDLQRIRMENLSDEVIIDTTTQQIMETERKVSQQAREDAIINEIKRIIELKSKEVEEERKQVESGVKVRESYLAEAEEKVARLRIELAQRLNELSKTSGGNQIESLNNELAKRSLQNTLNERKAQDIERHIAMAEELLSKADDYELLSLKTDIARENLRAAIIQYDRMNRKIRMLQPPSVSVIGGN